jgi:hypothetical protein
MITLEIAARPETADAVRREFYAFLERAKSQGWLELKVLFGFAWGNYIYEKDWIEEIMNPDQLAERVATAESARDGMIGSDDLYVTPLALGVKHTFCHEADIHLEGPVDSDYIASEAARLEALGWNIYERIKTPNKAVDSTATRVTSPAWSLRSRQEPRHRQP